MNRVIREKNGSYTHISNVFVRDNKLSLKAKGLLAQVMCLPSDWDFTIRGLSSIIKEGRDALYSAINELKDNGYCQFTVCRDEQGKIIGTDYIFYENPCTENPYTENPYTENPDTDKPYTENPPQINKEINKNNKETKERNNKKESKKGGFVPDLTVVSDVFRPLVEDWLQYKRERGERYKSQKGITSFCNKLTELSDNNVEVAKKILEQSYANNWAGIFSLKQNNHATQTRQNTPVGMILQENRDQDIAESKKDLWQ